MQRYYSFVIPVFNRPREIEELLESFLFMKFDREFEIVIIEDGSTLKANEIVNSFKDKLNLSYFEKTNSGPGSSRNYGMERAKGDYFIILDSDVLITPNYLNTVDDFLNNNYTDCYGGADAADKSFTKLQKAINYVMTSYLTTGGIRGSSKSVINFEPRSFNMGISKKAFLKTEGFGKIHPGEDPDLSERIKKAGFTTAFIPNAIVYHKRRISLKSFYNQVKKFGLVRPILTSWHPKNNKLTFWFPTFFVFFVLVSSFCALLIHRLLIIPLGLYLSIIFIGSILKNRSFITGLLTILALFIQFFGYGLAFLKSTIYINWLKKDPTKIFPKLFFT